MYSSGVHQFSKYLLYYTEHIIALGFYLLEIMSKKVYVLHITQHSIQLLRYSDYVKGLAIDGQWLDSW